MCLLVFACVCLCLLVLYVLGRDGLLVLYVLGRDGLLVYTGFAFFINTYKKLNL
jgi:hypothetical protein